MPAIFQRFFLGFAIFFVGLVAAVIGSMFRPKDR
jgi:hypothetical protein